MADHDEYERKLRKARAKALGAPWQMWRTPTTADTDRFIAETRDDPELRLTVLTALRMASASRSAMLTFSSIVAAFVIVFFGSALGFALDIQVIDRLGAGVASEVLWLVGVCFAVFLVVGGAVTLWSLDAARHGAWLSAYEAAIVADEAAAVARASRRRRARHWF